MRVLFDMICIYDNYIVFTYTNVTMKSNRCFNEYESKQVVSPQCLFTAKKVKIKPWFSLHYYCLHIDNIAKS